MIEENFIVENSTCKKRRAGKVRCSYCDKEFLKSIYQIKRTSKHYYNEECYKKSHLKIKVKCSYCDKEIEKSPSKLNNSKSGHYFCSRSCQNKGKMISFGLKEVQPEFYDNGKNYRERALRMFDNKCSVCNYNFIEVLEVHHKDHNRNNNNPSNWDILCPTHHKEYQLGIRKYMGE